MNNIKKTILFFICIFLAICQINSKVYSYTLEEVKEKIDFQIIEEGIIPYGYDIEIDANDLISSEKLPCMDNKSSLDGVLYGDADYLDLIDIDFFSIDSSNDSESWKKFRELIQNFFKIFLYIGTAAMLTLLIYIAVILVYSSISNKESILPFGNVFKGGKSNSNPNKYSKEKRFIEQWIYSFFILILLTYVINITISFSNFVTQISSAYKTDETEEKNITVYVKNSIVPIDSGLIYAEDNTKIETGVEINYTFKTNLEGLLMFQSQYNWEDYAVRNIVNMIAGFLVTCFKIFLYCIFAIRMVVVGILTAISPVLVLINAFMRVNGNKGFLKNWFIVYLFCVLLKPAVALIYYILIKSNVYLVNESPLYTVFVIISMFILIIYSIKKVIKNFKDTNKKNIANKKA